MPMYNLLEYSEECSMTSGSLWNYYRDEMYDVDDNVLDSKSFKHETKKVGKTWKTRVSATTTTKSRWIWATTTTATNISNNTSFKCESHYSTQTC